MQGSILLSSASANGFIHHIDAPPRTDAEEKTEHMLPLPQTDLTKAKCTMDIPESPSLTGFSNNRPPMSTVCACVCVNGSERVCMPTVLMSQCNNEFFKTDSQVNRALAGSWI